MTGTAKPSLTSPIQYCKGVGPQLASRLAKLDIYTMGDMLNCFPRQYEDRRQLPKLIQLVEGEIQSCIASVVRLEESNPKPRVSILKAHLRDASGQVVAVWFNQGFLKPQLAPGTMVYCRGKVSYNRFQRQKELHVQDFEKIPSPQALQEMTSKIMPSYPLVNGIFQLKMRQIAFDCLSALQPTLKDPLPQEIRLKHNLVPLSQAYKQLHLPSTNKDLSTARDRLVFDDFFHFQLGLLGRRDQSTPEPADPLQTDGPLIQAYLDALPYSLTPAQSRCANEIKADLATPFATNRLLQGDVGAGKTDVAMITLLCAIQSQKKAAIMAPTQLLAEQHFLKFKTACAPLDIPVVLLKGSMKAKEKRATLAALADEAPCIVVGTHALVEDTIAIPNIAVAVIDEQHRFGVVQRMKLKQKGRGVHCLFMTATPIPRSFMHTVYGDLEKSIIDEMPPGRTPQKTYFAREESLHKLYNGCRNALSNGRQLYVVYPLVEESEKLDLLSATEGYEDLANRVYPEFKVGLLHGRLHPNEKTEIMAAFKANTIQVLVATSVIEVGVDVPNASMMIIHHAERFGLSQLHQLRGRIGRGGTESQCYLVGDPNTPSGKQRLNAMVDTTDGFKIAEYDLKIRGPGDLLGTKQSGLPSFRMADLIKDEQCLLKARQAAINYLAKQQDYLPLYQAMSVHMLGNQVQQLAVTRTRSN